MSKRFAWLAGVVVLISIGLLVACSNYNTSTDGLMLVGSQGSGLIETFGFSLFNGDTYAITNTPIDTANEVCVLNGLPSSLVVNPTGTYAYAIINANALCPGSATGLLTFKVNSDGTATPVGGQLAFNQGTVTIEGTKNSETVSVVPGPMVMDASGKFLFVADRATTDSAGLFVPGSVTVFALGSSGSATEVAGSPFFTSIPATTVPQASLDIASVAPTATVYPSIGLNGVQNAVCSSVNLPPPTTEYLYAVDGLGNQVFEFVVNTSTGVLTNPSVLSTVQSFPADQQPAGVAVDPCNRFVYVSNFLSNKVSAYTICNGSPTSPTTCAAIPPGGLVQVAGSPFSVSGSANGLGPLVVDPYGNSVYVLGTLSNTISPFKISPISGALTALTPATVATGLQPTSIAIRGDDSWLFVTNFNAATVSQYSVAPETGALAVQPAVQVDNYPWGVAVK